MSRKFWWETSRLEQRAQLLRVRGFSFRFAPLTSLRAHVTVSEEIDPQRHIELAKMAHHPVLSATPLDDSAQFTCELFLSLGFNVVSWRREILMEFRELRMQLEEDIVEWWETLPPHGQHVYRDRPHPCPFAS